MDRAVISDFDRHVLAALRSNAASGRWPTAGDVGAQLGLERDVPPERALTAAWPRSRRGRRRAAARVRAHLARRDRARARHLARGCRRGPRLTALEHGWEPRRVVSGHSNATPACRLG